MIPIPIAIIVVIVSAVIAYMEGRRASALKHIEYLRNHSKDLEQ